MTEKEMLTMLERALSPLNDTMQSLSSEVKGTNRRLDALSAEMDGLKAEVGTLRDEVNGVKAELGAFKEEVHAELDTLHGEVNGVKAELGAFKEEVHAELDTLHGEVNGLKAEVGTLRDEVSGVKAEVGTLRDEVSGVKAELGAFKEEVHAELDTLHGEVNGLKAEVGTLQDGVNGVRVILESKISREIQLLSEGHEAIAARLPDPEAQEALEERVSVVEAVVRFQGEQIQELKRRSDVPGARGRTAGHGNWKTGKQAADTPVSAACFRREARGPAAKGGFRRAALPVCTACRALIPSEPAGINPGRTPALKTQRPFSGPYTPDASADSGRRC